MRLVSWINFGILYPPVWRMLMVQPHRLGFILIETDPETSLEINLNPNQYPKI